MKMTKSKTFAIGAILAAVMMISAGSLNMEDNAASAQRSVSGNDEGERLISVTGTAMTSIDPDLLVVTFGVETQEETAKHALDTSSTTMDEIIKAIKSAKITEDEINTSRFNIPPVDEGYEDRVIGAQEFLHGTSSFMGDSLSAVRRAGTRPCAIFRHGGGACRGQRTRNPPAIPSAQAFTGQGKCGFDGPPNGRGAPPCHLRRPE